MRVVIAPDKFAGTLTAVEAAAAIARGWRRRAPGDALVQLPLSDGGPGFVDVLHGRLGGDLVAASVPDPYDVPTPAAYLRVGDTAYVESAQVVGLRPGGDPERGSTRGLGMLLANAIDAGARRLVVGLGGTATNDGGAGMLSALGATADAPLHDGPRGLAELTRVDLAAARERCAGVEILAATDVESPLLGIAGATRVYGPQKGLAEERLVVVDGWLQRWADACDRKLAGAKGAGAAGGLGYGLLLLGAQRRSGLDLVATAVGLPEALAGADLALTGEGSFDFSSASGKVPAGVAAYAVGALAPCVVLAGNVRLGAREMRTMGIESAYSMSELFGEQAALGRPAETLADLAERVARTWSHPE